jgi:hypothetical protein
MKVVFPICCGVDVHKKFIVATLITTNGIAPVYYRKRFSTFNNSILKFKEWLLANECYDVCMESTGKYWVPVYNILEDSIQVTIANPKWVKAVKGNKNKKKDSKWIGDLFRLGLVPGSFIPPKDIRILREYTRYRSKLVSCKSSEKNRFQNALTVCNVALDSVVSDMFGVSASAITDYLISSESFDPEYCISLLKSSLKKKSEEVVESIEGYHITQAQKDRMIMVRTNLEFVEKSIELLDEKIDELVTPYENAIELLCTIPGVYLKPALVQVAHAAVKSNDSSYYKIKHQRISKRRGKKRAIIAIARMILTAVFHMFNTGEVFNPTDLYKIDVPQYISEKQKEKAIKQAIKLLVATGVISTDDLHDPITTNSISVS